MRGRLFLKQIVTRHRTEKPGAVSHFTIPIDKVFGISHHFPKETDDAFAEEKTSTTPGGTETTVTDTKPGDEVKTDAAGDESKPIEPQGY
jgi:hypothetical protein